MLDSVFFNKDDFCLELLDQTLLPVQTRKLVCSDELQVAKAIVEMRVRGAPAIGVAAAYSIALGLKNKNNQQLSFVQALEKICKLLKETRPTAVNLFWAIDRVEKKLLESGCEEFDECALIAVNEADAIKAENIEMCRRIGRFGAEYLKDGQTWLTHCNAGALATAGYGTALGVFRAAKAQGRKFRVFVDETRPLLQGSRLTAWELMEENIDTILIADNMAGGLICDRKIDGIVVGADRITSKGFVANKIGTLPLAVLAKYYSVPFYVAAPASTFDLSISYAEEIEIEERDHDELRYFAGKQIAPVNVRVYNPAFDITPPELVTAMFTDRGVIGPIYKYTIPEIIKKGAFDD